MWQLFFLFLFFWLENYLELLSLPSSCAFIFFLFFLKLRWAVTTRLEMILPNFILMCDPRVYSSTRNSRIISNRIFVLVWIEFRPWIIWAEIRWCERISLTCCYMQFQLDPRKSWHLNSHELIYSAFGFISILIRTKPNSFAPLEVESCLYEKCWIHNKRIA